MKIKKSFKLALNILVHSKLRSWLTIIGIIIGIAAVVSIVSISQGAKQQLDSRLNGLGADILTVTPGGSHARMFGGDFSGGGFGASTSTTTQKNLTEKDVLVLEGIPNIEYVMGEVSARDTMTVMTKSATVSITGVDPTIFKDITTETISQGRFLTTGDTYDVVLGGDLVSRTFGSSVTLNNKITINGVSFTVVGITSSGSSVYMPISVARTSLTDVGSSEFDSILVKVKDLNLVNSTIGNMTQKLMFERGIINSQKQDFSITNPEEMQATIQDTQKQMSLFLGAIAAISLLVGAIGIANTMFTSVLEKTKDIGIMKSLGAKNKDIMMIFLFNSALIGFVGGLGGIIIGSFGSGLIGSLASGSSTSGGIGFGRMFGTTALTPALLIGSLLFSVIVGVIAGLIPAYRASKLNPVDALRSE